MQHKCCFQFFKILVALELRKLLKNVICRLLLFIYSNCIVHAMWYKVLLTYQHN